MMLPYKPADEKRYTVTLDNVAKPELELFVAEKKKDAEKPADTPAAKTPDDDDDDDVATDKSLFVDGIRSETLNILADLVELTRGPKTAQAVPVK